MPIDQHLVDVLNYFTCPIPSHWQEHEFKIIMLLSDLGMASDGNPPPLNYDTAQIVKEIPEFRALAASLQQLAKHAEDPKTSGCISLVGSVATQVARQSFSCLGCGNGNRDYDPCCLGVRLCGLQLGPDPRLLGSFRLETPIGGLRGLTTSPKSRTLRRKSPGFGFGKGSMAMGATQRLSRCLGVRYHELLSYE